MEKTQDISRRSTLLLGAAGASALGTGALGAGAMGASALVVGSKSVMAGEKTPTIVELYTSQGCAACPPADKLLAELSKQPDIITLSLNVDYWDYLGWRDTLGSPEHTKRQKAYAANRGTRQIYTPQMVINGRFAVVGSRRDEVYKTIEKASSPTPRIPMTIAENEQDIVITVADNPSAAIQEATIWVMITSPEVPVPVQRGENRGKTITYHNVVREMVPGGMWDGKALAIKLPKDSLGLKGQRDCIALLQQGTVGKIIGATRMSDQHV